MTPEERAKRDRRVRPSPRRIACSSRRRSQPRLDLIRDDSLAGRTLVLWCGEEPRLLPNDRWE
jgi:hypothetical protein